MAQRTGENVDAQCEAIMAALQSAVTVPVLLPMGGTGCHAGGGAGTKEGEGKGMADVKNSSVSAVVSTSRGGKQSNNNDNSSSDSSSNKSGGGKNQYTAKNGSQSIGKKTVCGEIQVIF